MIKKNESTCAVYVRTFQTEPLCFIFSLYNIDTFAHKRAENKMTDSKYFTTTKKGEIFELKSELNNDKKEKKKEAVKKVNTSDAIYRCYNQWQNQRLIYKFAMRYLSFYHFF